MFAVNTGGELQMIVRLQKSVKNIDLLGMKEISVFPQMRWKVSKCNSRISRRRLRWEETDLLRKEGTSFIGWLIPHSAVWGDGQMSCQETDKEQPKLLRSHGAHPFWHGDGNTVSGEIAGSASGCGGRGRSRPCQRSWSVVGPLFF